MPSIPRVLFAAALAFFLFAGPVHAQMLSFGGRVVTVVPCTLGLHVTVLSPTLTGLVRLAYIWTPATLTFSFGPPRNPGQQILGSAYPAPAACATFTTPPVPLPGLIMFMVGTSLVL